MSRSVTPAPSSVDEALEIMVKTLNERHPDSKLGDRVRDTVKDLEGAARAIQVIKHWNATMTWPAGECKPMATAETLISMIAQASDLLERVVDSLDQSSLPCGECGSKHYTNRSQALLASKISGVQAKLEKAIVWIKADSSSFTWLQDAELKK